MDEDKVKSCMVTIKSTKTLIPQLDFYVAKSDHMFLFTCPNVDSSIPQCAWNNTSTNNNSTGTYLINILNLGSTMVRKANSLSPLLSNESHPSDYCSECQRRLSSSVSCSAAKIRDYPNCYTFEAFCMNTCSECQLDTVELGRLACFDTCLFTNKSDDTTLVGTFMLTAEEIWNSDCCSGGACTKSRLLGRLIGAIVGAMICFIMLILSLLIYFRSKRSNQAATTIDDDERRPLLEREQQEQRRKLNISF